MAKEVGNHDGVVWTMVISLKREDAEKLGYDNLSAWKTLLRAKSQDLANAMGVPITDMKWYAAFHNESGHPHVHLVSYSIGKEPYMTRQGLENLKAAYAHEVFKNDLYEIYEKQTEYRDELRTESKEKIAEIIRGINGKKYENETIENAFKWRRRGERYTESVRVAETSGSGRKRVCRIRTWQDIFKRRRGREE